MAKEMLMLKVYHENDRLPLISVLMDNGYKVHSSKVEGEKISTVQTYVNLIIAEKET